jgi:hypothetical protein
MKVDPYYVELAEESLSKAIVELRHAQQYLFRGNDSLTARQLGKTISAIRNRGDDLLEWLDKDEEC